jgi:hypothetical protein
MTHYFAPNTIEHHARKVPNKWLLRAAIVFLCGCFDLVVAMTPEQALAFVLVAAFIDFLIG